MTKQHLRVFRELLTSSDMDVRMEAGENLALLHESRLILGLAGGDVELAGGRRGRDDDGGEVEEDGEEDDDDGAAEEEAMDLTVLWDEVVEEMKGFITDSSKKVQYTMCRGRGRGRQAGRQAGSGCGGVKPPTLFCARCVLCSFCCHDRVKRRRSSRLVVLWLCKGVATHFLYLFPPPSSFCLADARIYRFSWGEKRSGCATHVFVVFLPVDRPHSCRTFQVLEHCCCIILRRHIVVVLVSPRPAVCALPTHLVLCHLL